MQALIAFLFMGACTAGAIQAHKAKNPRLRNWLIVGALLPVIITVVIIADGTQMS